MRFKTLFLTLSTLFILGSFTSFSQEKSNEIERIKSLITKKREFNKKNKIGFRIQLYNGKETKVRQIRAGFRVQFPNTKTYLTYVTPEWKIQVGEYKTRLEADRALLEFHLKYASAIVVPL